MTENSKHNSFPGVSGVDQAASGFPLSQSSLPSGSEGLEPAVPLSHYLWVVRRNWIKISAFVILCMIVGVVVAKIMTPKYESTASINVDLKAPYGVVGQAAGAPPSTDMDTFVSTQIDMILSDAVLRPVVDRFHLNTSPNPRVLNQPIFLEELKVKREPGTSLIRIHYRDSDPQRATDIANAIANSYIAQTFHLRFETLSSTTAFLENQLAETKDKMDRSELAVADFEKNNSMVSPGQGADLISSRLAQINTQYTGAQADRVSKESAWNAFKNRQVDVGEVPGTVDAMAKATDILNQAKMHFEQTRAVYGSGHPEYRKAEQSLAAAQKQFDETRREVGDRIGGDYRASLSREQMLAKDLAATKAEWDEANTRSVQFQQLKQVADSDKALYDELVRKIKEADINSGFQASNISLVDPARPAAFPVFPNLKLILLIALLASILLGVSAAIVVDALDTTLRDPQEAAHFLSTEVVGMLPRDAAAVIDMRGAHISGFDEAIRTVRNSILLSDFDQRLRSIVVTSAASSEGKSTLAAHLAVAYAARGKRTLLVDGDLRMPSIHSKFGFEPAEGLSNILGGNTPWQQVVRATKEQSNLHILFGGPSSRRAADLIGPKLSELLDEFAKSYDIVILDAPPVLGFAESLQMASAADGVLMVTRAGATKRKLVATALSDLTRLRAHILGVVLNDVSSSTSADVNSLYGNKRYKSEKAAK